MEDIEPTTLEWAEDICEVCGANVGYGVRLFHLGRCDEHAETGAEGSTSVTGSCDGSSISIDAKEGAD